MIEIVPDDSPWLNKCPECGCELRHHNMHELEACAYLHTKTSQQSLDKGVDK